MVKQTKIEDYIWLPLTQHLTACNAITGIQGMIALVAPQWEGKLLIHQTSWSHSNGKEHQPVCNCNTLQLACHHHVHNLHPGLVTSSGPSFSAPQTLQASHLQEAVGAGGTIQEPFRQFVAGALTEL